MKNLKKNLITIIILILCVFSIAQASYAKEILNNNKSDVTALSGIYEPKYEPDLWNNDYPTLRQTNCYGYSVFGSVYSKVIRPLPINPGAIAFDDIAEYPYFDKNLIVSKIEKDLKMLNKKNSIKECGFNSIPMQNQRKIALFITEDKITDYHFYLHNDNGYWSHKRGRTNVTNLDADGKLIKNPELANRNYGRLNYTDFCGYYMITILDDR